MEPGSGKVFMVALLILIGTGALIGLSLLTAVCICAGRRYETRKSDCIIVLGAKIWPDGRMSHTLLFRCEKALEAWKAGIAPVLIVCGGQVEDEPETEAAAMGRWFEEKGVPAEQILQEDKSADTQENLKNARRFMEENGMETAAMCTSDYHITRAMWLARAIGIEACGLSAPTPLTPKALVLSRLRETVSWALYFLKLI